MSDISKCAGDGCPHAEICWRVLSPVGARQSWFAVPPVDGADCDYYIPAGDRQPGGVKA